MIFLKNISNKILEYIKTEYGYSEDVSKWILERLSGHADILKDFYNYIMTGNLSSDIERLSKDYHLSVLGAFNFSVYLKGNPQMIIK